LELYSLIRGCRPPEAFLLCHDCFGRWEHKLIGASTHLAFLQGVNYDVHGWVGFVYLYIRKKTLISVVTDFKIG